MNNITPKLVSKLQLGVRNFSITAGNNASRSLSCKVLVVGGGSGGCTVAAKLSRRLKKDSVIILEPSNVHYYQPLWTLVGAGVYPVSHTRRDAAAVLPRRAIWLVDAANTIHPEQNKVITKKGDVINYEYIVMAVGMENNYEEVPGLLTALEDKNSGVSTIYSAKYAEKTFADLKRFQEGNAIFTFPNSTIKCPGAPQKIAYLADSYLTKTNKRSKADIYYNTCTPHIFGVKKYADELVKVAKRKNIKTNYNTILKEVRPDCKEAVFYNKDNPDKDIVMQYKLLHAVPPMRTPAFLRDNKQLTDEHGFLTVDKYSLQHVKFPNMFGLGDCTNTPNSKTAAAVAKQSYVVDLNLMQAMSRRPPASRYDGYGACPLVTCYNKCIMAEFLYDGVVHETFPFDQSKEHTVPFYMKRYLFPFIYWHFMLKGFYNGPEFVRKIINPFSK